jgi:hypothetical protein
MNCILYKLSTFQVLICLFKLLYLIYLRTLIHIILYETVKIIFVLTMGTYYAVTRLAF